MTTIEIASFNSHSSEELDALYNIVIKGYEITEAEIWGKNYVRVFRPEYDSLIEKGQILIAKYNGEVAGGIHFYRIDNKRFTFSLLATDFRNAGKGIGKLLIEKIEFETLKAGGVSVQMEVLRVKDKDTESKLRLDKFYKKLGYTYSHSEDCICKIPIEKYKKLEAPSNFDFYIKELTTKKHSR